MSNKQLRQPVSKVIVLDLPADIDLLDSTDQCILVQDLHHRSHQDAVSVISHNLHMPPQMSYSQLKHIKEYSVTLLFSAVHLSPHSLHPDLLDPAIWRTCFRQSTSQSFDDTCCKTLHTEKQITLTSQLLGGKFFFPINKLWHMGGQLSSHVM